ncbi:MAG: hypothetical protein JXR67_11790 [Bacteroidales bacterium]|nr:hypothetical protein [Bacteroidales bacterium]
MLKLKIFNTIVLIFFVTSFFLISGCSASRNSSAGDLNSAPNWKNLYLFHSGDSTWIVKPVTEAGNHFAGIIYKPEVVKKSRQVRIYAEPLSAVKIENGRLTVPMENIVKVENYRIGPGVIIGSIGLLGLLFLIPTIL